MAIVVPSFVPKYNPSAYMWKGISDIFGDITSMREDKFQRQRQETLDAQRLTAAQSVERNRQQIYDQRAAEAERLAAERKRIEENRMTEEQWMDALRAREGKTRVEVPFVGAQSGPRRDPAQLGFDFERDATRDEKLHAQYRLSSQDRDQVLNLATLSSDLRSIELHVGNLEKQKIEITNANLNTDIKNAQIEKLNEQVRLAKDTYNSLVNKAESLAANAASVASVNEEKAERSRKLSEIRNTLSGRGKLPVETQVGPESFQTSIQPIKRDSGLYNQALRDFQIYGSPNAAQLKALGVADDTVASRFSGLTDREAFVKKSKAENYKQVDRSKWLAQHIKELLDENDAVETRKGKQNFEDLDAQEIRTILSNVEAVVYELWQRDKSQDIFEIFKKIVSNPSNYSKLDDSVVTTNFMPRSIDEIISFYDESVTNTNNSVVRSQANQEQTNQERVVYTTNSGRDITLSELQTEAQQMSEQHGRPFTPLEVLRIIKESGQ